jgi:formamidopyrimidine-DNA glycosylase
MPELPDLEYVAHQLQGEAVGRTVDAVRVKEPIVLRVAVAGTLGELLVGKRLTRLERHGNFLVLDLEPGLQLIVNPMLAGRFQLVSSTARSPAALCFALSLGSAGELRYLDDKKMGKVYVVPAGDWSQVPLIGELGDDVLAPAFTLERFAALVKKRRDQVRPFLMDKRALSAIGNAYADEILFAARIHPKTRCSKLTAHDVEQLHAAIGTVLRAAIDEVARRGAPIEEKVRDFLQVRGRAGQPCPRCGSKIRTARVVDADACFCPACQPATRTLFIDWTKADKPR